MKWFWSEQIGWQSGCKIDYKDSSEKQRLVFSIVKERFIFQTDTGNKEKDKWLIRNTWTRQRC